MSLNSFWCLHYCLHPSHVARASFTGVVPRGLNARSVESDFFVLLLLLLAGGGALLAAMTRVPASAKHTIPNTTGSLDTPAHKSKAAAEGKLIMVAAAVNIVSNVKY